jgi:hypothetical protein
MLFLMHGVSYCNITLMQMWISASLFGKVCRIFLPSTPTQRPHLTPVLSTYSSLLQEYSLYLDHMAGDHFHCAQLAEETYRYRPETFLLLPTGYHSLGVQFITGLTFQLMHSSQQTEHNKKLFHIIKWTFSHPTGLHFGPMSFSL